MGARLGSANGVGVPPSRKMALNGAHFGSSLNACWLIQAITLAHAVGPQPLAQSVVLAPLFAPICFQCGAYGAVLQIQSSCAPGGGGQSSPVQAVVARAGLALSGGARSASMASRPGTVAASGRPPAVRQARIGASARSASTAT